MIIKNWYVLLSFLLIFPISLLGNDSNIIVISEHSSSMSDQICAVDSTVFSCNGRIKPSSILNDEYYGTTSYRNRSEWVSLGPDGGYVIELQIDPQNPEILYAGTNSGGGAFKTTNGGNSWNSIGLCTAYIMTIAINPQTPSTIYAGSYYGNEGCFKSTDGGTNWTQHSVGNHNIGKIVIDPLNPSIMYAGTYSSNYDGVYKSTDGGESWFQTGLDFGVVYDLAIDPQIPTNLYATIHIPNPIRYYLYKSTDGGDTWAQTDLTLRTDYIAIHPDTTSILYAGTWSGIYKSTDFGESWSSIGLAGIKIMSMAIDPISPSTLYAGMLDGGMYKSTDGGSSWTGIGLAGADVRAIVVHPLSPDTLYAGTFRGNACAVYKSTDAGASWNPVNNGLTNFYSYAVAVDPSIPTVIYAGTNSYDGLYKSTDGGSTWFVSGLTNQNYIYDVVVHPDSSSIVYAVASYGGAGAFKSTDAGASWNPINNGMGSTNIFDLEMNLSDPGELYVGTAIGVYHSTNGGALWQYSGLSSYDNITKLAIDPNQTSIIYAGTMDDGMFKSTDGGGSWIGINSGLTIPQIRAIAIDHTTTTTLYVGTYGALGGSGGGIFKSTDGGNSWNLVGLSGLRVVSLAISGSSPTTVYAGTRAEHVGEGKGMYRSTDGGITWNEWNKGLNSEAVMALDISNDNILFAATNGTSIYSRSLKLVGAIEGTVTDINTGNPIENAIVFIEDISDTTVFDGTYLLENVSVGLHDVTCTAEGYDDLTIEDITVLEDETVTVDFILGPTGVDDIVPEVAGLLVNFPNPFKSTTIINFSVENSDKNTTITIYNLNGQKIKTLVNKKLNAGMHQAVWDGTTDTGKPVGSGIYFYQLNFNNKPILTKKMILNNL